MLNDDETNSAVKHYKKLQKHARSLQNALDGTPAAAQPWKNAMLEGMDYFKKKSMVCP